MKRNIIQALKCWAILTAGAFLCCYLSGINYMIALACSSQYFGALIAFIFLFKKDVEVRVSFTSHAKLEGPIGDSVTKPTGPSGPSGPSGPKPTGPSGPSGPSDPKPTGAK